MTIPLIAFALFSPFAPRLSLKFGLEPVIYTALVVLLAGMVLRVFPTAARFRRDRSCRDRHCHL